MHTKELGSHTEGKAADSKKTPDQLSNDEIQALPAAIRRAWFLSPAGRHSKSTRHDQIIRLGLSPRTPEGGKGSYRALWMSKFYE